MDQQRPDAYYVSSNQDSCEGVTHERTTQSLPLEFAVNGKAGHDDHRYRVLGDPLGHSWRGTRVGHTARGEGPMTRSSLSANVLTKTRLMPDC